MSAIDEMEERNQHEAYQRGFAEGAKQERERIVKILESWNPFQTTFGEVMESLCKQHEGAPMTPQPHCEHECHGDLCFRYRETMALGSLKDLKPCPAGTDGYIHCIHDTRTSRPAPSPIEDTLNHLHDQYKTSTSRPAPSPDALEELEGKCIAWHRNVKWLFEHSKGKEKLEYERAVADVECFMSWVESLRTGGEPR